MGVEIDEKDYWSTIISSLPIHLSNFASNQLAVARMYAPLKTIDPDALISLIAEEYDCQHVQHAQRGNTSRKAKVDEKNEALSATPGQLSKGKDNLQRQKGVCWNCGEKGHYKDKCPKLAKKKDDTVSKTEMANVAIVSDSDSNAAFLLVPINDKDAKRISKIDCDKWDSFFDGNLDMADTVDTVMIAPPFYFPSQSLPCPYVLPLISADSLSSFPLIHGLTSLFFLPRASYS